jgi:hypothetical protein
MNVIELFLYHHQRGCPANKGGKCECKLFAARRELERLQAIEAAQLQRTGDNVCPLCGLDCGDALVHKNCAAANR